MDTLILLAAAPGGEVWGSLRDILVLLAVAMTLGVVAEHLRQSAVIGYLFAGTLVGPGGFAIVATEEHIFAIAEMGVALLLFSIGLEFSPRQLFQLGRVAAITGPLQVVLTWIAGTLFSLAIGLATNESLVIGAMCALSSTACVLRVLRDRAEMESPRGRLALGILLVQDMAVVPLVLVVTALSTGGTIGEITAQLALSLAVAAGLVVAFLIVFRWIIPRLFVLSTLRRNRDLPILLSVCIAGGAAWLAHALSISPSLGAFIAGMLLAASPFATQIQADIQPLRTVLVTLFFAAIGLFGDPVWLIDHLALVSVVLVTIVVGKTVLTALLAWLAGMQLQFAVSAGFALAQIGEFSFVLATIARGSDGGGALLSDTTFSALVSATILSLLITPYLVSLGPRFGGWLQRTWQRRDKAQPEAENRAAGASGEHHDIPDDAIIVVGFGPAGQRLVEELLTNYRHRIVVVDLGLDNLAIARRYGTRTVLGDATQTDVLAHAGISGASMVVITLPVPTVVLRLIHNIRQLNVGTIIVARSRYHIYRWELTRAGAHVVIDEEDQVGQRLAVEVDLLCGEQPSDEGDRND